MTLTSSIICIDNSLVTLTSTLNQLSLRYKEIHLKSYDYTQLKQKIKHAIESGDLSQLENMKDDHRAKLAYQLLDFLFKNNGFLNRVKRGIYSYKLDDDTVLHGDNSTYLDTRILFAVKLIDDIKERWPNNLDLISLASVGAGRLFQEYLIIKALSFSDYNNIKFCIIDSNPEIMNFTATLKKIINNDGEILPSLKNRINNDEVILTYYNSYKLINDFKKKQNLINICYMISPNTFLGPAGYYVTAINNLFIRRYGPQGENVIDFRVGDKKLYLYFPYDQTQIFAISKKQNRDFAKAILSKINEDLKKFDSDEPLTALANSLGIILQRKEQPKLWDLSFTGNDIRLSFYSIVKEIGTKPCLSYSIFADEITPITPAENIDQPYFKLNCADLSPADAENSTWHYDINHKQFIAVI